MNLKQYMAWWKTDFLVNASSTLDSSGATATSLSDHCIIKL